MGQKVNPNILRLGVTKHWKTEFFEKKIKELPKYTFRDLELKNYTERFLNNHGLVLHDYRQKFSNSFIVFYLSYFITPHFLKKNFATKKIIKMVVINSNGEKKTILKFSSFHRKKRLNKKQKNYSKLFANYKIEISSTKIYKYLMLRYNKKFKAIKFLNYKKNSSFKGIFLNFLKTINLFTNNKYNIILNISCLNNQLNVLTKKKDTKRLILKFKRFKNNDFFKEGIELLLNSIANKNSADLLAKFVAGQIKKDKKQKFFLSFLKKVLTPLLQSNISIIKGIQIKLKGRLNGAPKAKEKTISVGDVSAQSISTFVDYSQHAVHNKNGTYGIKIWTALK